MPPKKHKSYSRTSIRGHRGCIVMDDSDGIIVRSGRIDLTVHACFISLGAPVADAQRWVEDTLANDQRVRIQKVRKLLTFLLSFLHDWQA